VPLLSSLCPILNAELHPAGLPVWQAREDFVAMINGHQTTILVGETGSGKTTQIAQFIAEAGYCSSRKLIACTQVRVAPCRAVSDRNSHACIRRQRPPSADLCVYTMAAAASGGDERRAAGGG